jgi:hypothetical protein
VRTMGMVTRGLTGLGRMRHRNEAKIMTLKVTNHGYPRRESAYNGRKNVLSIVLP